jgi:group I intron endonuclease
MAPASICQSGIYCIRNIVSGRVYVGSAVKIRYRWNAHRHLLRRGDHHSIVLQRSWDKHGKAAFAFEILEAVADLTKLVGREQFWIDHLNAACPERGFNRSPTAGSPLGTKHSPETRAKHSAARKGKTMPPRSKEHRARIAAAKLGTKRSIESRSKQGRTTKGRPISAEQLPKHKARLAARNRIRSTGDLTNQLKLL